MLKKGSSCSKVLIVTDTFPPEKVGSYRMNDLATNLKKDGYDVTVLCPPPTFPFGSFKRVWKPAKIHFSNGVKVINLWTWQPKSARLSKLSRIAYYSFMPLLASTWMILNNDFDVVITSSGSSPFMWLPGLFSKKVFNKTWFIDERDLLIKGAISLGFLKKDSLITNALIKIVSLCYSTSDLILVTAESARKGVLSYGALHTKVKLIPNGAETDIFYPMPLAKKRQLIYAGNIGYAQDFDCVISAMCKLVSTGLRLIIVGEGEVKDKLRALVSRSSLEESVIFLDGVKREKLPSILSESMIGLAPLKCIETIEGSIPAKVFDYMACGVPFIAFGGSDLRVIAERSKAGFVIDADPDVLVKTILLLDNNPIVCREMGQNGRDYCEKYYNRRLMAKKIESLICQCI